MLASDSKDTTMPVPSPIGMGKPMKCKLICITVMSLKILKICIVARPRNCQMIRIVAIRAVVTGGMDTTKKLGEPNMSVNGKPR